MRRARFAALAALAGLASCGGKGHKTLPPPDGAPQSATATPGATDTPDAGAERPGYRVVEIKQAATVTLAIPAAPAPPGQPEIVQQSPHDPDPCTLSPDASFAFLTDVAEGAAATPGAALLAVRCGHLIPRALVLAPGATPLTLVSRDDARHLIRLEAPDGSVRRIPLALRGARVAVTLPPGITRMACELHDGEVAHVLVSEHPYAAVVTGDSVRFDNLPAPARAYQAIIAHVGAAGPPVLLRRSVRSVVGPADEPAAGAPPDEPPQAP